MCFLAAAKRVPLHLCCCWFLQGPVEFSYDWDQVAIQRPFGGSRVIVLDSRSENSDKSLFYNLVASLLENCHLLKRRQKNEQRNVYSCCYSI